MSARNRKECRCPVCQVVFSRRDAVRRHMLAVHELGWIHGQVTVLSADQLDSQMAILRRGQMSARKRRALRVREEEATKTQYMARVSSTDSSSMSVPEPVSSGLPPVEDEWMSWPTFEDLMADGSGFPTTSVLSGAPEHAEKSLRPPPAVCYHAATQTERLETREVGVSASSSRVSWPSGISHRQLIRMVEQHPDWSMDQLTAELKRCFPSLGEDEQQTVIFAMVGVAWGLQRQASQIVAGVTDLSISENVRADAEGLWASLNEQSSRRF